VPKHRLEQAAALGACVLLLSGCGLVGSSGPIGGGLKPGTVPSQYTLWVGTAGSLCQAVPPAVIAAQVQTESAWNPHAVSPAGAQGIAQFLPGTWSHYGQDANGDGTASIWDPADAIVAMGRYDCAIASDLSPGVSAGTLHGDLTSLALAGYNAGEGAVVAAHGIPPFIETQSYVATILRLAAGFALTTPVGASGVGAAIVAAATKELGLPYVYGGGDTTGPTYGGFDCSGLTQYAVYVGTGGKVTLPRTSSEQRTAGVEVPRDQMQPGDIIIFNVPIDPAPWGHVGIYGQMLHAPHPGTVVRIESITTSYWTSMAWDVRRVA
jgi:cell wall-associated NlpC family hydrolase